MGYKGNKLGRAAIGEQVPFLQPPVEKRDNPTFMRLWRASVEDYPPEHFREGDRLYLETYVSLAVLLEEATVRLEMEPLINEKGEPNPLLRVVNVISGRIGTLGRSLRLTPSSRMAVPQTPRKPQLDPLKAMGTDGVDVLIEPVQDTQAAAIGLRLAPPTRQ